MTAPAESRRDEIRSYVIGWVVALTLTGAAFALVEWRILPTTATLSLVFGLALLQMIVHFRYFLHVGLGKTSRDDLQLILFSSAIVAMMVAGTLVILANLRERMM